ncbi:YciI family protein [Cyanobium sp. HWJ4-Hawea]|uniref:YciI family protein n=1 Tax=Cyanobium sp. HWJ4-Hawea TaxID=2823713 RepID=UPI0020CFC92A|nr:YciI family protein [Cyanobium sp. HWJ4-Hawea]
MAYGWAPVVFPFVFPFFDPLFLTMAWFVKLEEGIVAKDQFDAVIPAHLRWLAELEATGHSPSSGYWAERKGLNGDGAGGMLLFSAQDWAQADALVRTDPLIEQGCVRWSLHQWNLVFASQLFRSETGSPGPR